MAGETVVRREEKEGTETQRERQSKGKPGLRQPWVPDTNSGCRQAPSGARAGLFPGSLADMQVQQSWQI